MKYCKVAIPILAIAILLTACTTAPTSASLPSPSLTQTPSLTVTSMSPPTSTSTSTSTSKPTPTPTPTPAFEPFTLAFAGDTSFAENYHIYQNAAKEGYADNLDACFGKDLLEHMRAADVFMVNCESAVASKGTPMPNKPWRFLTSPETAKEFVSMGADIINLANNHTFDYQEQAFLETLSTFEDLGIPTVGAGKNAAEAYAPVIKELSGVKIAFFGFTMAEKKFAVVAGEDSPGVAGCFDTTAACTAIKAVREEVDFIITAVHFGNEYTTEISKSQQSAAYAFIDAGADFVFGGHSHIPQGMDVYNGKLIIYSLGNFLFNNKSLDSALLELTFTSPTDYQFTYYPCYQANCHVNFSNGSKQGLQLLADLRALSPKVSIDEEGHISIK